MTIKERTAYNKRRNKNLFYKRDNQSLGKRSSSNAMYSFYHWSSHITYSNLLIPK
ncbi:hypothetical protein LINPERHAP1_LOCUS4839 [Linum perenne]